MFRQQRLQAPRQLLRREWRARQALDGRVAVQEIVRRLGTVNTHWHTGYGGKKRSARCAAAAAMRYNRCR